MVADAMFHTGTRRRMPSLLKQLGVAALYALLAKFVLTFFSGSGAVSVIWPSSGLALAALLIGGKRYSWSVFLGAFLSSAMTGITLIPAVAIAIGNTLEALIGAWLLSRNGGFDLTLQSLRSYLLLILAGCIGSINGALNGVTTLLLYGFMPPETYLINLTHWWMGDVLGIALITPLVLVCWQTKNDWLGAKRVAEAALLLGLTFLAGQVVFLGWFHDSLGHMAQGYVMFLFITWVAVRLGTRGTVIALSIIAVQALLGAYHGIGFFANDIAQAQLANYWLYTVILSVVGMALATFLAERQTAEKELLENKNKLQATLDAIPDLLFEAGLDGRIYGYHSPRTDLLDVSPDVFLGNTFSDVLPPNAAEVYMSALREAHENGISMGKQYELLLPQGKLWFELSISGKPVNSGQEPRFIFLARDITERKAIKQQLRNLSAHMLNVREEEKARIAREIHDDLGGTLTALKIDAYWLSRKLPANEETTPLLERITSMSQLIDNAVGVTRRIITDLRPTMLDDLGLLAALEWQAAQFHKRTGIECRVNCIEGEGELDKQRSIALFRIFQEALTNVVRHSGASRVEVEFCHSNEEASLSVSDNGHGMQEQHTNASIPYGMLGMTERAEQLGGTIKFGSPPNGGLSVMVILPLPADNKRWGTA